MSVMDFTEWDSENDKASKQMLMKSNEICKTFSPFIISQSFLLYHK